MCCSVANENLGRAETLTEGLEPLRLSGDSGTDSLGQSGVPACASYPHCMQSASCSTEFMYRQRHSRRERGGGGANGI